MNDAAVPPRRSALDRLWRWGGFAVFAGNLAFIGERLWRLDWLTLEPHVSWNLAGALIAAAALFAAADHTLSRAWAVTADLEHRLSGRETSRIYGQGTLMKYLPSSVFQYVSRHVGGTRAGLPHKDLARSTVVEIGLHVVSSLTVATGCLVFNRSPFFVTFGGIMVCGCLIARRRLLTSLALQIVAFGAFALAAALIGAAILPAGTGFAHFAALFLLAWLAGFVVPVAPAGIGVREAALLAMAGTSLPTAGVLAVALALRAASIAGDLAYGITAMALGRKV